MVSNTAVSMLGRPHQVKTTPYVISRELARSRLTAGPPRSAEE